MGIHFSCIFRGYFAHTFLLGQWLNFKLFGITYLVGKIKFKLYFRVHRLSEYWGFETFIFPWVLWGGSNGVNLPKSDFPEDHPCGFGNTH